MGNARRIVKNGLYLYFRMFLVLGVTLYSSRLVLKTLGVSDYGIYNIVGGIVLLLGFFNAALTSASQRFIAFDIGKDDVKATNKTFNTSLAVHFFLAIFLVVLLETIGLWYVNNKLVFDSNRNLAVNVVYQFSILSFFVSILQVPYNALILAKEKMNVYAYISILEAILKLLVVWVLVSLRQDKLIAFSVLTFLSILIVRIVAQIYCKRNFIESKFKIYKDYTYMMTFVTYSSWNLIGNLASVVRVQGNNIMLNLFFGTLVNAAFGLTNQITNAVNLFVTNFQNAFNPQIIKKYAGGDIKGALELMLYASKISFYVILLIVLPLYINLKFVLNIWLGEIPNYLLEFTKISLFVIVVDSLSGPIMTMITATGKIKYYHIIVGGLMLFSVPVSYLLLRCGYNAEVVFNVMLFLSCLSYIVRLVFLRKLVDFDIFLYLKRVCYKVLLVFILLFFITLYWKELFIGNTMLDFLINSFILVVLILVIIISIGFSSSERKRIFNIILNK
ncbi:MATE family efflux transporter [Myroides odoratimimus]|uniref:lipopolysaccharide biosynthesis protein n=1 Tax=Myroides odoratimimus TaxID=76832 RepID=UPI002DBB2993|nr:lipopolysaccharide biosynthesis protein [Myroides odoratimimus]MEC4028764.1 lipopolysaccharide biosynthesis protein [Myroides odoratimimus]